MDYTLENLIMILRSRLQDEEYDEDSLKTFLNQAQDEILGEEKYPFMERVDTYFADEKGEISLPLGYAATTHIFARKDEQPRHELLFIAPDDFFENTEAKSMVYTKYGNIIFYRINGNTDNDGYEITHLYLANPRPMVEDDDKPAIPAEFMEALLLGALYRAEQRRDNFDYAQIYQNQMEQLLVNMKLRYGPGNLSASNRAKLPFGGNYNG